MFLLAFIEEYLPTNVFKTTLYGAIALLIIGNLLLHIGLLCPKCKAIIGFSIVYSAGKVQQCPRCGINFDEDLREPGI